jgi:DNA modification methylase
MTKEELDVFLMTHTQAMNLYVKPGASIYWCHDIRFNAQFKQILETNKYHVADVLIWKKNNSSVWMTNYAKYYEPILYGWKEGAKNSFYAIGMQPNTIDLDKLEDKSTKELIDIILQLRAPPNYQEFAREPRAVASLHPTVKPAALIAYHLINSSKEGDIVYDGFSGSGSTLIAATRTKRKAYCIELEPKFVDVTIARWQEETSTQAYRESDNVKWDDIDQGVNTQQNLTSLFDLTPEQNDALQEVLNG